MNGVLSERDSGPATIAPVFHHKINLLLRKAFGLAQIACKDEPPPARGGVGHRVDGGLLIRFLPGWTRSLKGSRPIQLTRLFEFQFAEREL
jgi:hypothetical protein